MDVCPFFRIELFGWDWETSGYYYICTHGDEFKVIAKNPSIWIEKIASAFIVKWHGARNYYLDNDYTYHDSQDI